MYAYLFNWIDWQLNIGLKHPIVSPKRQLWVTQINRAPLWACFV